MNGYQSIWLKILFVYSFCNVSFLVVLPDKWKDYVKEVIEKFEEGKIDKHFHVIQPPRELITTTLCAYRYTLPNLYVRDPLLQYADVFSNFPITCLDHPGTRLSLRQWTDGSPNSLNPHVILDI